ncbi:MAG: HAD family phosphatase [Verrucomicrobia bacterium]|nr:HAD family phosphatase [Verrucomicrobiota bacterium]
MNSPSATPSKAAANCSPDPVPAQPAMPTQPANLRLVVFDLGKVLVDFDYHIAARQLSPHTRFSPDRLIELMLRTPLLLDYERGAITSTEFYDALVLQTGLRCPFPEFASRFGDIFSPIEPMIELLEHLRALGLPTAVLSNTNELAIQDIRAKFHFFAGFKHHILSYEHRAMKPDPALYHALESTSGFIPSQIVFLDDRPENVEVARKLGWHAFVHHDPAATRRTFTELGLLPD